MRCGGVRCEGVRCGGVRCGGVRCGGVRCGTGVDRLLANQKTLIYIFFWITDQFTRIYIYVCFFFSFLWS